MVTKENEQQIGEVLVKLGYVSQDDLERGLALKEKNPGKKLGQILVEMGCATDEQVFQAIEAQWEDWLAKHVPGA